jgi:lysozyme
MKNEKEILKKHEGFREGIYIDTVGVPTGGYGHAFLRGSRLPKHIWEQIFEYDFGNAMKDYDKLNLDLSPARAAVIRNMLFNMGLHNVLEFKKMFAALRKGDYETAADEMLDSKWAKQVGPGRSDELAEMMRTGVWPNEYPI